MQKIYIKQCKRKCFPLTLFYTTYIIYIVLHLHITSYTLTQYKPKSIYMHKSGIYTHTPLLSFACSRIEIFAKLAYLHTLTQIEFSKTLNTLIQLVYFPIFFSFTLYLGDVRKSVHPSNKTSIYPYPYDPLPWPGLRILQRIYILTQLVLNF